MKQQTPAAKFKQKGLKEPWNDKNPDWLRFQEKLVLRLKLDFWVCIKGSLFASRRDTFYMVPGQIWAYYKYDYILKYEHFLGKNQLLKFKILSLIQIWLYTQNWGIQDQDPVKSDFKI